MKDYNIAFYAIFTYQTLTPLMIRSGFEGEFTDSCVQKTPDGQVDINGHVWSSLIRRALLRIKGTENLINIIGKYRATELGVSPLWVSSSAVKIKVTDVRPGNRVERSYGCAATGALFSDEVVPAGIRGEVRLYYFGNDERSFYEDCDKLFQAFSIISSGIENIGGGWSYGFGRLKIDQVFSKILDLRKESFNTDHDGLRENPLPGLKTIDIQRPWVKYEVIAEILPGQLLAIHTKEPIQNIYSELPDMYVYSGHVIKDQTYHHAYIIPGRTIRQALFSIPIERKLRSTFVGECCMNAGSQKGGCTCRRCKWFGSFNKGGIIAVTDGIVEDAKTVVLHRIQLDEHSLQNLNLFSAEYLTNGRFRFQIFIDNYDDNAYDLEIEIENILSEMKNDYAPPGWYRLGATSTSTGHVKVIDFSKEHFSGKTGQ